MMPRRRRLFGFVAASLSLLLLQVAPAGQAEAAALKPAVSAFGRLTGQTTITWTGNKGITLKTPRQNVRLPEQNMLLSVRGGSFAFVFIESQTQIPASECPFGLPRCMFWYLAYLRDWNYELPPGTDHVTSQTDPPDFSYNVGRPLYLYLMTDGQATLVLRPTGFSGKSSYQAGGRIHAKAMKLPTFCDVGPCDPQRGYADALQFGGASYDVGKLGVSGNFGYAASALSHSDLQSARSYMLAPVKLCDYPNPADNQAPAEPGAHAYGCDQTPRDPMNDYEDQVIVNQTLQQAEGLQPVSRYRRWIVLNGRRGLQYEGYQIGSAGGRNVNRGAYAFWFSYGIS